MRTLISGWTIVPAMVWMWVTLQQYWGCGAQGKVLRSRRLRSHEWMQVDNKRPWSIKLCLSPIPALPPSAMGDAARGPSLVARNMDQQIKFYCKLLILWYSVIASKNELRGINKRNSFEIKLKFLSFPPRAFLWQ